MIWLKNSVGVIGNNSPRATSGARQRSTRLREARIFRALRVADLFGPFGARYFEQEARLAPVVHDPVEMGANQPRDALARAAGGIERRDHAGVIALQDFQEQRAGKFLLRAEEMEEAAVGGPRAAADRRDGGALKPVAVEHGKARGKQILSGGRDHENLPECAIDHYSRVIL